jgi:hypothetical protein
MMLVGQDTARHCGCRIIHEVAVDAVVLRIHAGVLPERPSADEPVQFMLTGPDLDVLIDSLRDIRRQIDASADAAGRVVQLHRQKENS